MAGAYVALPTLIAVEVDFRWKSRLLGSTQPTGIVCADGQLGGAHELDGDTATSDASHFLPALPLNVRPGRQSQPPPMLFAQTPLALWTSAAVMPPTAFSNVLLTMRAFASWPMLPCSRNPK